MSKLKAPLLSFGAKGSLGKSLTFQEAAQGTNVRSKPTPTDPYTLAQAYHRWDYQDYAYQWRLLTLAQKATWETNARPHRITGFNYYMRTMLTTRPDIIACYRLDEPNNNTARDTGPHALHATIHGASRITGVIDHARYADGLDDYIALPNTILPYLATKWTLEAHVTCFALDARAFHSFGYSDYQLFAPYWNNITAWFALASNFRRTWAHTPTNITDGLYHTIDLLVDMANIANCLYYIDGKPQTISNTRSGGTPLAWPYTYLLAKADVARFYKGNVDHVVFYNRLLDVTEMERHSERRYPP